MAIYQESRNLVVCPYDPTHTLRKSKLHLHMTKCGKKHKGIKVITCQFNALHKVKPGEMERHLLECEDRNGATRSLQGSASASEPPTEGMRTDPFGMTECSEAMFCSNNVTESSEMNQEDSSCSQQESCKDQEDSSCSQQESCKDQEDSSCSQQESCRKQKSSAHDLGEPKRKKRDQVVRWPKPVRKIRNMGLKTESSVSVSSSATQSGGMKSSGMTASGRKEYSEHLPRKNNPPASLEMKQRPSSRQPRNSSLHDLKSRRKTYAEMVKQQKPVQETAPEQGPLSSSMVEDKPSQPPPVPKRQQKCAQRKSGFQNLSSRGRYVPPEPFAQPRLNRWYRATKDEFLTRGISTKYDRRKRMDPWWCTAEPIFLSLTDR